MLATFLDYASSPITAFALTIGSICLTIAVAIIVYFKQKRSARLQFVIYRQTIVGKEAERPNLTIFYRSEEIKSVYIYKIALWNSGNHTILKDALNTNDPLKLKVDTNGRILDISAVSTTDSSISLTVHSVGTSEFLLTFDFLEPGQGGFIEVVSDRFCYFSVAGKIVDHPRDFAIVHRYPTPDQKPTFLRVFREIIKFPSNLRSASSAAAGLGLFLILAGLLAIYLDLTPRAGADKIHYPLIFLGFLYLLVGFLGFLVSRAGPPKEVMSLIDERD